MNGFEIQSHASKAGAVVLSLVNVCVRLCLSVTNLLPRQNWPAQPDNPSMIRVASVIAFSVCQFPVLCSLSVLCHIFSHPTAV